MVKKEPSEGNAVVNAKETGIRRMLDAEADYSLMARWLSDQCVLEFYEGRDRPHDMYLVREHCRPLNRGVDDAVPCIMTWRGTPVGYVQHNPVDEIGGAEYGIDAPAGTLGIDLFIGKPDLWGRGIGTRALSGLAAYLFDTLDANLLVIDPQMTNERAIRSYEKRGFRKVKVLPGHEHHEGKNEDAWLMTLAREA